MHTLESSDTIPALHLDEIEWPDTDERFERRTTREFSMDPDRAEAWN